MIQKPDYNNVIRNIHIKTYGTFEILRCFVHLLTFAQHVASFVCVYLNRKYLWHMHEGENEDCGKLLSHL